MNTSVGTRPGVFMSTADTLSWVTRPLACERALSPGVWPAVHGSHTVRMVIAALLMGIDGEVERRGGGRVRAGIQQPHSHQLGWWLMPQASRRALRGTCAGFCEQIGFAHLWSIQLSPEAHGQAHKPEDVT